MIQEQKGESIELEIGGLTVHYYPIFTDIVGDDILCIPNTDNISMPVLYCTTQISMPNLYYITQNSELKNNRKNFNVIAESIPYPSHDTCFPQHIKQDTSKMECLVSNIELWKAQNKLIEIWDLAIDKLKQTRKEMKMDRNFFVDKWYEEEMSEEEAKKM